MYVCRSCFSKTRRPSSHPNHLRYSKCMGNQPSSLTLLHLPCKGCNLPKVAILLLILSSSLIWCHSNNRSNSFLKWIKMCHWGCQRGLSRLQLISNTNQCLVSNLRSQGNQKVTRWWKQTSRSYLTLAAGITLICWTTILWSLCILGLHSNLCSNKTLSLTSACSNSNQRLSPDHQGSQTITLTNSACGWLKTKSNPSQSKKILTFLRTSLLTNLPVQGLSRIMHLLQCLPPIKPNSRPIRWLLSLSLKSNPSRPSHRQLRLLRLSSVIHLTMLNWRRVIQWSYLQSNLLRRTESLYLTRLTVLKIVVAFIIHLLKVLRWLLKAIFSLPLTCLSFLRSTLKRHHCKTILWMKMKLSISATC